MSTGAEEFGFDDVDSYHNKRSQNLASKAGLNKRRGQDSDDDSEVEVMRLSEEEEESSDEESSKFGFEKDIDSDEAEFFGKEADEDEDLEAEEGWGDSKNNYYGGDDIDENDPEVARRMEEEALRQQKKHLEELNMDDYMDEDMVEDWSKSKDSGAEQRSILVQDVPKQDISTLSSSARLDLLKNSYPEFIPLTKELSSLKPKLDALREQKDKNEMFKVKFTSLSAYLGSITTYLAIFLSNLENEESNFSMKDHPVMESILVTRECWRQANELPDEMILDVDSEVDLSEEDIRSMKTSVSSSEESDSEEEEDDEENNGNMEDEKLNIDVSSKRNIKKAVKKREDEIDDVDAEEKRSRRRTLRFYTSKIDQVENKKDTKFGGDEDLPYKERLYERQQRLVEEARKRGTKEHGAGVDLDDNDLNSDDERYAQEINNGDDQEYYNSLKNSKKAAKEDRMAAHKEAVKAGKEGRLAELQEVVGEDGKRAVNYQIMKNKGLTPHRNKDNRNSRVKKRKKYEKAQKKLKSVRSVFSGQQGPYAGEKTGIKKGLSKSVKLV